MFAKRIYCCQIVNWEMEIGLENKQSIDISNIVISTFNINDGK